MPNGRQKPSHGFGPQQELGVLSRRQHDADWNHDQKTKQPRSDEAKSQSWPTGYRFLYQPYRWTECTHTFQQQYLVPIPPFSSWAVWEQHHDAHGA
jgi:hypothetical protein